MRNKDVISSMMPSMHIKCGKKIICLIFASWLIAITAIQAQDYTQFMETEENVPVPVTRTFRGTRLTNIQTNEIVDGFEFNIQHRFGQIISKDILYNFLGMDLPANIRFSLAYPVIKNRLMVEIGRTKFWKNVDMEIKYQVLRQTEKNEIPVSVAIYANPSISTVKFSNIPANAFFADSITPFENKTAHRINYYSQLVIARKFTEKFSFQLAPVLVYKNLADVGKDNHTLALNAGGRFMFSRKGSVLIEYNHVFNNRDTATVNPLSLAVEFGTVGHVFQIVLSSTNQILGKDIYTNQNANYAKGEFYLGFNIIRVWEFKE